jgi:hypothetical protein
LTIILADRYLIEVKYFAIYSYFVLRFRNQIGASFGAASTPFFQGTDYTAMGKLNLFQSPKASFDPQRRRYQVLLPTDELRLAARRWAHPQQIF